MMWDETRGNQRWIFPDIPDGEWVDSTMALARPQFYIADDNWNEMKVYTDGVAALAEMDRMSKCEMDDMGNEKSEDGSQGS